MSISDKLLMLSIYVAVGVISARVGASIAKEKNLDVNQWTKYCFMFNFFAIFILMLSEKKKNKEP